jgi:hypothetical protein
LLGLRLGFRASLFGRLFRRALLAGGFPLLSSFALPGRGLGLQAIIQLDVERVILAPDVTDPEILAERWPIGKSGALRVCCVYFEDFGEVLLVLVCARSERVSQSTKYRSQPRRREAIIVTL